MKKQSVLSNHYITLRHRRKIDADMDVTPMIDCVFLLLIFFLVCSTLGKSSVVQLPKAHYGVGVNPKTATVLTLAGSGKEMLVYAGAGTDIRALSTAPDILNAEIIQIVEQGIKEGKNDVVICADKRLYHGEVVRVESAVVQVPKINLYVIVDNYSP